MLDWPIFAINAAWIIGLSIMLAELGWQDWLASETHRPWADIFKERSSGLGWTSGVFLSCVGWGFAQADRSWEKTPLFLAAVLFGWRMIIAVVHSAKTTNDELMRDNGSHS